MTNALNKWSPGSADSRHLRRVSPHGDFQGVWKRYLPPMLAPIVSASRGANGHPECSGWKSSATDPLHPNSNEIKAPSGRAESAPSFVNPTAPKTNGSIQSVPDPFAPNPNDINAVNGRTEWTPVMSKNRNFFTYYGCHLLPVDKHRGCLVASVGNEVHRGTISLMVPSKPQEP